MAAVNPLTPKQGLFVMEYVVDLNGKQAAVRAGYSARTAEVQASRLLSHVKVQAAIRKAQESLVERVELSQEWVIDRLKEIVERSMASVPVLDAKGEKTGVYSFQGTVANRALELLGKHMGMFVDRKEFTVNHTIKPGLNLEELEARIQRLDALEAGVVDSTGVVVEDGS
jgi:phage terminase small subunit